MDNKQVIPSSQQLIWNDRKQKYELLDLATGKLVPTCEDYAVQYSPNSVEYSPAMADMVCGAIREGRSLQSMKNDPAMPPLAAIQAWKALNPDFKRRMEQAYRDRAEYYHDKAIELALEAPQMHKDFIPGCKLAVSTLQWAAERGDVKRYSGKDTEQQGKGGVTIIIDTGVSDKGTTNINIDVGDDGEFRGFINEQTHTNGRSDDTGPECKNDIELTQDRWTEVLGDITGERTHRTVRSCEIEGEVVPETPHQIAY